ncbi:MAG: CoA-binding protein [Dehalococcoidia bacterium]|nr:CoA-binding protein [Dehalococcoidia bacterium]
MTKVSKKHSLDFIFHPKTIAIVGVSSNENDGGHFKALLNSEYYKNHTLYPVNPKMNKIKNFVCYPSILECPTDIDYVISRVPAPLVLDLVKQCIEKKVKTLHLFTAGFGETGEKDREKLGTEILKMTKNAGIRVIGPNCMGLYVPEEQISFTEEAPPSESGDVFVASQSGVLAAEFIFRLASRGIRFSKVVSFGNGADLSVSDFLEYAANDNDTKYILSYIEGITDGKAFLKALKLCASRKPTIIIKGGMTEEGARAASSHTGSLAGSADVFESLCKQFGVILVDSIEEAQDILIALKTSLVNIKKNDIISISSGGGNSVLSSDTISKCGLQLPTIDKDVQHELRSFIPMAGTSIYNPIDFGVGSNQIKLLKKLFKTLSKNKRVDCFYYSYGLMPWMNNKNTKANTLSSLGSFNIKNTFSKKEQVNESFNQLLSAFKSLQRTLRLPIAIIHRSRINGSLDEVNILACTALENGVPFFDSSERASKAIKKIIEWNNSR